MISLRRIAVCLLTPLALPGCCAIFCTIETPESPPPLTRDTPEEAVGYLVEALDSRRVREIYESLHPDLRKDLGGFSLADFTTGFSQIEGDIEADARLLENAEIRLVDFHPEHPDIARVAVRAP